MSLANNPPKTDKEFVTRIHPVHLVDADEALQIMDDIMREQAEDEPRTIYDDVGEDFSEDEEWQEEYAQYLDALDEGEEI